VFFLKEARNTLKKGLLGIYAILEKERTTGIIKATVTAVRGAAVNQWKEAFCAGETTDYSNITEIYPVRQKTSRKVSGSEVRNEN